MTVFLFCGCLIIQSPLTACLLAPKKKRKEKSPQWQWENRLIKSSNCYCILRWSRMYLLLHWPLASGSREHWWHWCGALSCTILCVYMLLPRVCCLLSSSITRHWELGVCCFFFLCIEKHIHTECTYVVGWCVCAQNIRRWRVWWRAACVTGQWISRRL